MVVKSRNFLNKRSVSPLIATVLLISFAVALGSIVLNLSRTLHFWDECSEISIKVRELDESQACYFGKGKKSIIHLIIKNNGNKDIDGLGIWITGEKGSQLQEFNYPTIEMGGVFDTKYNPAYYDYISYGRIKNIQIFPKVKKEGALEICTKNSLKLETVLECPSKP